MTPQQALIAHHKELFKSWASRDPGDFQRMLDFMHPDSFFVGSGLHELGKNREEFAAFIKQEHEDIPLPPVIEAQWFESRVYDNMGFSLAMFDIKLPVGEHWHEMKDLRMSLVWINQAGKWKIVHAHTSAPWNIQQEGEGFPLQELQERNLELEKMIAEKTADLVLKNRELEVEAALERVRAKAMAMRSSDDLNEVADELRRQMGLLGQRDLEVCVIHLYELHEDFFEAMAAIRPPGAGGKIFKMQSKIPKTGIQIVEEMMVMYRSGQEEYVLVNEGEKAMEWFEVLKANTPEIHQLLTGAFEEIPRAYWSFADFSGGSLGMITYAPPEDEARDLLRRSATVFDLAYRRFLDLQKAETQARRIREEKDRLEKTLEQLQATQSQLIQQEKLASLGQLTAGIAHEIKNPLNFVNNFSEVSMELLAEAMEEIQSLPPTSQKEELQTLLDDVQSNLRKIHHHGSRADGIVRSMLLHSRGGSGQPEPTDLNALLAEYVNLAFHGMRAGKDPINVTIDLDLDEQVNHIPLLVEDFSRVILNLCSNAFDAMRSKLVTTPGSGYQPLLRVRTKRTDNSVYIEIADNGPGIPAEIRDRVLEPFFTTKKGTEGTGLGLSITNDIIKAHRGSLTLETASGMGTIFKIKIPNE